MPEKNYFQTLNDINVNGKTEKKNGLTYLSWAWAWAEVKKLFPDATYTIYENADGWFYHTDGKTAWVKTGVTVNGIEHVEYLPVMNHMNKSIPLANITSFDVNKSIQRSLTKACARHGIGLYIYAGEDLPEEEAAAEEEKPKRPTRESFAAARKAEAEKAQLPPEPELPPIICQNCGKPIKAIRVGGKEMSPQEVASRTKATYGWELCYDCTKTTPTLAERNNKEDA